MNNNPYFSRIEVIIINKHVILNRMARTDFGLSRSTRHYSEVGLINEFGAIGHAVLEYLSQPVEILYDAQRSDASFPVELRRLTKIRSWRQLQKEVDQISISRYEDYYSFTLWTKDKKHSGAYTVFEDAVRSLPLSLIAEEMGKAIFDGWKKILDFENRSNEYEKIEF